MQSRHSKLTAALLAIILVPVFHETSICAQQHLLHDSSSVADCGETHDHADRCASGNSGAEPCQCEVHEHVPIFPAATKSDAPTLFWLFATRPSAELMPLPAPKAAPTTPSPPPPASSFLEGSTVLLI